VKRLILALLVSFALLLSGCASQTGAGAAPTGEEKMGVAVTLLPQKQIAERIGGNHVDVVVMVPPGASPHSYEPTPQQMAKVADSKIYFMVGSGVEFEIVWMEKVLQTNPQLEVVNGSENIKLIEMRVHEHGEEGKTSGHEEEDYHYEGAMDPHVWTSVRNTEAMARSFYAKLVDTDPKNAEEYKKNLDGYLAELHSLDSGASSTFAGATNRKFIVFHPAWGYFAADYGLEQIAMEDAGKEPTPRALATLVEAAGENSIKVVFVSPQFSAQSANSLAQEIGGKVVVIDPLAEDYIGNTKAVISAFSSTLK